MKLSTKILLFTVFLIAAFSLLGILIMPACAEYITAFSKEKGIELSVNLIYAFGTLICLPCLAILITALGFARAAENDEIFSLSSAKRLQLISFMFFIDCILALLGIIALFLIGEFLLAPIFLLFDLVGLSIGVLLWVLAGYIKSASLLKEEVDYTL